MMNDTWGWYITRTRKESQSQQRKPHQRQLLLLVVSAAGNEDSYETIFEESVEDIVVPE